MCREVDVGAARVKLVKHKTVGKTPSADKEVWDVLESDDENLRECLAKGAVFIAEESDGEEKKWRLPWLWGQSLGRRRVRRIPVRPVVVGRSTTRRRRRSTAKRAPAPRRTRRSPPRRGAAPRARLM